MAMLARMITADVGQKLEMILLIFANISLLGSCVCFAMDVVNAFIGK